MSAGPTIGASAEVIAHHVEQHGCGTCLSDCLEMVCACGTTVALACALCRQPLFIVVRPGTWCWHAEEAHQGWRK